MPSPKNDDDPQMHSDEDICQGATPYQNTSGKLSICAYSKINYFSTNLPLLSDHFITIQYNTTLLRH